jgi:glycerol uptake facilitator-like aquaporin
MTIDRTQVRPLLAEMLGTAILLAAVVGSGIMAAKLSGGNDGIALLANSLATGAVLFVLITIFGAVSGAHFNPAVTGVMWIEGKISRDSGVLYIVAQIAGGVLGVLAAHAMFELPLLQASTHVRHGFGQWFAEAVATFGLIITIFGTVSHKPDGVATAVALYIVSAYWFTASTSFANPAVTLARAFTDTFAGIAPANVIGFITAQLVGAGCGLVVSRIMFRTD